ncbi:hypothetical protein [uncultured Bacteroides sp.]|uniref:hypothetical protein n=1 Tax=uncultured Bacteroides sp. TaxID=162156 RepID=UPI0025DDA0CF|nr:hypothetical protein [uncultured Bacteroides sp.]
MKKCIHFISLLLLMSLWMNCGCAQTTYYYKMVKRVVDNKHLTDVSGGQFITFLESFCYESNYKGVGVGHGRLRSTEQGDNFRTYRGISFWDQDSFFRFNKDLTRLNVITQSGAIYVYIRATPSSSVKTCSLIRGTTSYNGTGNSTISPMQENSFKTEKKSTTGSQKTKRICHYCNGKGKIVRNLSTGQYGVKKEVKVRCNECGGYYLPSTGHSHIHCSHCRGTGYVSD